MLTYKIAGIPLLIISLLITQGCRVGGLDHYDTSNRKQSIYEKRVEEFSDSLRVSHIDTSISYFTSEEKIEYHAYFIFKTGKGFLLKHLSSCDERFYEDRVIEVTDSAKVIDYIKNFKRIKETGPTHIMRKFKKYNSLYIKNGHKNYNIWSGGIYGFRSRVDVNKQLRKIEGIIKAYYK